MAYELQIRTPDNRTRRESLPTEEYNVGRAHTNDLCFPEDASLSRKHLRLKRRATDWVVADLGSKNGTLLNGTRIHGEETLKPGDCISAGQILITLIDPELKTSESIVFVPEAGPALHPDATVMTSLEGLLPAVEDSTTPPHGLPEQEPSAHRDFDLPVVRALILAVRELAGHRPLDELFRLILELSIETVRAERGVLMTLEGTELVPRAVIGEGFRISTTVRDRVVNEKTSVLVRNVGHDELGGQMSIVVEQIQSLMAVPLQTEKRVIGLVYVDSRLLVREFTPDDLNLLTVLANVAAIRIEHERLLQVQQQEQVRTRDLEQAAEIQRSILPVIPPAIEGFTLAGRNAPSRMVGGDYFDFIVAETGRLTVVVGDVAGKGMSAALLMSNLQARFQTLAERPTELDDLVARLDRSLSFNCPSNRFITLFVCRIDVATGEIVYCNAGHNPALLVRADGDVLHLRAMGTVLGVLPDLGYEQRTEHLEPGDVLAIYSDGVTEATSPDDEEFGESRLAAVLREARLAPADEIADRVEQAVDDWTHSGPLDDDSTLVIVRRNARS